MTQMTHDQKKTTNTQTLMRALSREQAEFKVTMSQKHTCQQHATSIMIILFAFLMNAAAQPEKPSFPLFYHHQPIPPVHKRQRRLQETSPDGYGIHFMDVFIGNPAQRRRLAVQTASDYTAFPCQDCTDCGGLKSSFYNFTQSPGFVRVPCGQCTSRQGNEECQEDNQCKVSYNDLDLSSWKGYEVVDASYIAGPEFSGDTPLVGTDVASLNGFPMLFVCQTKTRGYYANQVQDGILSISPAPTSFINQAFAAGKLPMPRVALCYDRSQSVRTSNELTQVGAVTLGGYDTNYLQTEMVYARNLANNKYRVNFVNLYLRIGGGTSVLSQPGQQSVVVEMPTQIDPGAYVDNGIPYLTLDERWEAPFRVAWKVAAGSEFSYAQLELTEFELLRLPTLLLELEGNPGDASILDPETVPNLTKDFNVLVAVPAAHYMERVIATGRYRPRIQFDGQAGSFLGANVMQGHTTVYELDMNRIGFAEVSQCPTRPETREPKGGATTEGGGASNGENGEATEPPVETESTGSGGGSPGETMSPPSGGSSGGDPVSVDDDLVPGETNNPDEKTPPPQPQAPQEVVVESGGCKTAMCRCFIAVGYVAVGTSLAVAYRVSRPKEKSFATAFAHEYDNMIDQPMRYTEEDMSSVYRRKTWEEEETGTYV